MKKDPDDYWALRSYKALWPKIRLKNRPVAAVEDQIAKVEEMMLRGGAVGVRNWLAWLLSELDQEKAAKIA